VLFGRDLKELANTGCTAKLNDKNEYDVRPDWKEGEEGKYLGTFTCVLCEGCGPIQVDADGNCVSEDCIGDHRTFVDFEINNVSIS
jgi:hypothetical protein